MSFRLLAAASGAALLAGCQTQPLPQAGSLDAGFGEVTRYNAAVQVFSEGDGRSRLVWTVDLLPDDLAPAIGGMMDHAVGFMKKTLDAA